jgi:hypothetical protein
VSGAADSKPADTESELEARVRTEGRARLNPSNFPNHARIKACMTGLVLALLVGGQWPDSSLVGRYQISTGFEIWTVELEANHSCKYSWQPDHPGGSELKGSWKLADDLVTVTLSGKVRNRAVYHVWSFVPVVWGERQYLIAEDEIRDFAGMALSWEDEHKDLKSQATEFHRAPLMRTDLKREPHRSGLPRAPGRYAVWFQW